ncbi:TMhelix containing protein [Vibrio phage 1.088.O._10N.261.46.A1]|nr:TMhelix containing protein [Vibrio phage 1.088.O._10N.261.46.A1]
MKIFTHTFVIYDRGWAFRWEPKQPQTPYDIVKSIVSVVFTGLVFAFISGVL